jgi:hypothetical protein
VNNALSPYDIKKRRAAPDNQIGKPGDYSKPFNDELAFLRINRTQAQPSNESERRLKKNATVLRIKKRRL